MTRLLVVADDLTGALDTAVGFAGAFGPVLVCRPGTMPGGASAAAVDIGTRELPPALLRAALTSQARLFEDVSLCFKKIDSLLRGHWALELASLWASGGFDRCVVAPAFPQQGRLIIGGRLYVLDLAGIPQKAAAVPIVDSLVRAGLKDAQPARVDHTMEPFEGVAVFDIGSEQALADLAAAGRVWPGRTLWVGSAGLARALAQAPVPVRRLVGQPMFFVLGSVHARTAAQLARLRALAPGRCLAFRPGDNPSGFVLQLQQRLQGPAGLAVLTFDLPLGTTTDAADAAIEASLAALLPGISRPGTLFASGGQTLAALCDTLGCTRLVAHAEWAPGIVFSKMDDGAWAGLDVVSKSGAFGGEEVLTDLAQLS